MAIRFAYRDVEAAFDYFLEQIGPDQPFIIAGHSQGSLHLQTLLFERINGTPTADRIVAAYLIGWGVEEILVAMNVDMSASGSHGSAASNVTAMCA